MKRYIIMADGTMNRWKNQDVPKHLLTVRGESLLSRTVRLFRAADPEAEILITSHNPAYDVPGAVRYEPQHNVSEIDRFTWELIDDQVCFLYGDVYYSEEAARRIAALPVRTLGFAGSDREIFAVKVGDGAYMRRCIRQLKERQPDSKGWHLYRMAADEAPYCRIDDDTTGFNTEEDYRAFSARLKETR